MKGTLKIISTAAFLAAAFLSPGLSPAGENWAAPLLENPVPRCLPDAAGTPAPSRPPRAPATLMFYLDDQNGGDYVDSYIARQLKTIEDLSRRNRAVRWLTISAQNGALPEGKRYELEEQNLAVTEWDGGTPVPRGDFRTERKEQKPSFSNPAVLAYFVEKGLALGSARNILVMADHGEGSHGLMTTTLKENGKDLKEIMRNRDAAAALAGAMKKTDSRIDLIVLDACLMSSIEAMTDFREEGLEMPVVASENTTTPTSGSLNYRKVFGGAADALEEGGPFDALLSGAAIVEQSKGNSAIDLSLVNLRLLTKDLLESLNGLFSGLASELREPKKNKAYRKAFLAKITAEKTINVGETEIDLRAWLQMLQKLKSLSEGVRNSAAEIERTAFPETSSADVSKLVAASENDKAAYTSEKGLSISHPLVIGEEPLGVFEADCRHAESLRFSALTGWAEVLKAYAGVDACEGPR